MRLSVPLQRRPCFRTLFSWKFFPFPFLWTPSSTFFLVLIHTSPRRATLIAVTVGSVFVNEGHVRLFWESVGLAWDVAVPGGESPLLNRPLLNPWRGKEGHRVCGTEASACCPLLLTPHGCSVSHLSEDRLPVLSCVFPP